LCIDTFVGIYGHLIKKLTRDYFIKLYYEVKGINMTTNKNHLDEVLMKMKMKKIIYGILKTDNSSYDTKIFQKLNISRYAFDLTKNVLKTHCR